jgi:hypothetical protein
LDQQGRPMDVEYARVRQRTQWDWLGRKPCV